MLSSGTRHYKRTHYLYAISQISAASNNVVTGIFGDEILKVGRPSGGAVISELLIHMIDTGFIIDDTVISSIESAILALSAVFSFEYAVVKEDVTERIRCLTREFGTIDKKSTQHFVYRFNLNLRKYFGSEASSYNDYVNCHSPFIDKEFFNNYISTSYASYRHPYSSHDYFSKFRSAMLYAKLVNSRYPSLLDYDSSRGYAMKSALSYHKLLYANYLKMKRSYAKDSFNTDVTTSMFINLMRNELSYNGDTVLNSNHKCDLLSLKYWTLRQIDKFGVV